jgi:hypothetical protein
MSFQAMAWAVNFDLPVKQKMVLLMLANRTNADTGRCDPSMDKLAADCGMSKTSVKSAIRDTNMSTGIFDVWTAVFTMKAPTTGDEEQTKLVRGMCLCMRARNV